MKCPGKDSFDKTCKTKFLALLAEPKGPDNYCSALNLENQLIIGLVVEARELSKKVVEHKRTDTVTTPFLGTAERDKARLPIDRWLHLRRSSRK